MANSYGIIGAMVEYGYPVGSGAQSRHDRGGVTADGGRYSPIDDMDRDRAKDNQISPAAYKENARRKAEMVKLSKGAPEYDPKLESQINELQQREFRTRQRTKRDALLRSRKSFQVTDNARTGGSGLFHGDDEDN